MSAQRIQRRRVAGWRLPEGARIVDRTTRFGNPFTVADATEAGYEHPQRAVVSHYRAWLENHPSYQDTYLVGARTYDRRWVLANLGQLAGRDLACPCSLPEAGQTDWCHAAVLIELSLGGAA